MIHTPVNYTKDCYRCKYLVIGTGAGGSIAGALLAEHGNDVIMLEEGRYYPRESFVSDLNKSLNNLYRNRGVSPFLGIPPINFLEACCVGGGPVVNGGLIWRPSPWKLEEWQNDYGLSGYAYSDLEKHFKTIEHDLHVEIQENDLNKNLDSLYFFRGAERLGWKAVNVPRAAEGCVILNQCMTGCPTGAKKSTLETYIQRALKAGCRIFSEIRAVKIEHFAGRASKVIAQVCVEGKQKNIEIFFDFLVISGGAVQTPCLLNRSKISRKAGAGLQFNYSLKVAARFKDPVYAKNSTPFTMQIQEFLHEGLIINVSQFRSAYLALCLTQYPIEIIEDVMNNQDHFGLYIGFMSSQSKAHILSHDNKGPLVWYRFDKGDLGRIKKALRRICELLFAGGAIEIYLPVAIPRPVRSLEELDKILEDIKPGHLDLVTVHVMSSCPMGSDPSRSVVDLDGKVWGMENVMLCDASILPSCFGESPQGTIMSFAHEIVGRHLQ